MKQYDDAQFVAEDKADDAARPKNKWDKTAAAMDASLFDFSEDDVQFNSPVVTNIQTQENEFYQTSTVPPKTARMSANIEEEPNPLAPNIDDSSAPTTICTDNPNNIIKEVSNNNSTVNIIEDKLYTEKSNNYYDNIDNKILRTAYEGIIVFEDFEDAEEPNIENVTINNSNNNITVARQLKEDLTQEAKWAAERAQREEA